MPGYYSERPAHIHNWIIRSIVDNYRWSDLYRAEQVQWYTNHNYFPYHLATAVDRFGYPESLLTEDERECLAAYRERISCFDSIHAVDSTE